MKMTKAEYEEMIRKRPGLAPLPLDAQRIAARIARSLQINSPWQDARPKASDIVYPTPDR